MSLDHFQSVSVRERRQGDVRLLLIPVGDSGNIVAQRQIPMFGAPSESLYAAAERLLEPDGFRKMKTVHRMTRSHFSEFSAETISRIRRSEGFLESPCSAEIIFCAGAADAGIFPVSIQEHFHFSFSPPSGIVLLPEEETSCEAPGSFDAVGDDEILPVLKRMDPAEGSVEKSGIRRNFLQSEMKRVEKVALDTAEILKLLFEALFRSLARDLREPLRENIPLPFLKIRREMELEDHPRPLAELARRTGYSTARFSVLFRKFFGVPPIRFSHELRMERAADFLMNRNWNVSEVADRVGYAQIQQFSRAFKKYFGVSPEEMRRRDDSRCSGM